MRLIATVAVRFTARDLGHMPSGVVLGGGSEVDAKPTLSKRVRALAIAIVLFMVSILLIAP